MNEKEYKPKIERYAALKKQISALEKEAEELSKEVKEIVETLAPEGKEVQTTYGTFSVVSRRKWEYPSEVKNAEESLKRIKMEAEAKGFATYTEIFYLKFTADKVNE